ncbi:MAG: hypothetical protein ACK4YU_04930, partial [Paracoccus sp. (in: a-proteobacteria)]
MSRLCAVVMGVILLYLAGNGPALADRTIHVAAAPIPQGTGTAAAPFSTISLALESGLTPGDTVMVGPGTYLEQVFVNPSGAPGRPITLKSAIPGGARIRPPPGSYSTLHIRGNHI